MIAILYRSFLYVSKHRFNESLCCIKLIILGQDLHVHAISFTFTRYFFLLTASRDMNHIIIIGVDPSKPNGTVLSFPVVDSLHVKIYLRFNGILVSHSKILRYPKLLFQRENAFYSFRVQRVLVTQPRPSRVVF
jgi:hypothetical protein